MQTVWSLAPYDFAMAISNVLLAVLANGYPVSISSSQTRIEWICLQLALYTHYVWRPWDVCFVGYDSDIRMLLWVMSKGTFSLCSPFVLQCVYMCVPAVCMTDYQFCTIPLVKFFTTSDVLRKVKTTVFHYQPFTSSLEALEISWICKNCFFICVDWSVLHIDPLQYK